MNKSTTSGLAAVLVMASMAAGTLLIAPGCSSSSDSGSGSGNGADGSTSTTTSSGDDGGSGSTGSTGTVSGSTSAASASEIATLCSELQTSVNACSTSDACDKASAETTYCNKELSVYSEAYLDAVSQCSRSCGDAGVEGDQTCENGIDVKLPMSSAFTAFQTGFCSACGIASADCTKLFAAESDSDDNDLGFTREFSDEFLTTLTSKCVVASDAGTQQCEESFYTCFTTQYDGITGGEPAACDQGDDGGTSATDDGG